MPGQNEWTFAMGADVPLSSGTTKTVLTVLAGAGFQPLMTELSISFDGTVATREAILVELTKWDGASTGTGSTAVTPRQTRGGNLFAPASSTVGARNYTTEPTVHVPIREWLVEPKSGGLTIQFPLGREPSPLAYGDGYGMRCTAPDAVNCRGYFSVEVD